ncbi:MAG: ectoine/hydroxyectoine ABC transporter permease subunit EhuD [Planctomycetes bacterium]|nr:ectoine/hydroxyectoine ABC transporter permease subunit EhuD [Planctomycetota bacterium]NUQ34098.1 ectoine/hydroxyectoine ABC transporter permease subunit EhuD [Planctomycetaceae bacterium]
MLLEVPWDWMVARDALPVLGRGVVTTLLATCGGMMIALMLGLPLVILRRSRLRVLSRTISLIVEFVRGTPLLIQLFFVYFLLSGQPWASTLTIGIVMLGVHYACYVSEVYRSGIEGVSCGQWDAAKALNMSRARTWISVILPQAIPPIVPALGNYLVAMLKDTPLLFAITLRELLMESNNYASRAGSTIEVYTLLGLVFLVLSLAATALIRWTEKRLLVRGA